MENISSVQTIIDAKCKQTAVYICVFKTVIHDTNTTYLFDMGAQPKNNF